MRQCVIWLILLPLCGSEYVDYSDYQPISFPLRNRLNVQSENQSPEYNEFIKSRWDNWKSPISYLKKRGYMPVTDDENLYNVHTENDKNPEDVQQSLKTKSVDLIEVDQHEAGAVASKNKSESHVSESKTENPGIINKVKDKVLGIFSSRSSNSSYDSNRNEKIDSSDREYEQDGSEFDSYELPVRTMFARNAVNKTAKLLSASRDDLKSLTETDIMFIKNFIKCFKDNKKVYESLNDGNKFGSGDANDTKKNSRPNSELPKNLPSTTESCYGRISTSKSIDSGTKNEADDITVDLDINENNGTGQVIMADRRTTECAPLHLNDMSFDLRWNKNKPLESGRENMNVFDNPFLRNRHEQSLAASFLQDSDENTYAYKNEQLHNPQCENFLDSQQKLPNKSDQPLKVNTESKVPSYSNSRKVTKHLSDMGSLQDTKTDFDYDVSDRDNTKRRTRMRPKSRGRMRKKSKHKSKNKSYTSIKPRESDFESMKDEVTKNNYKLFDGFDDESVVSKLIANLNSSPEKYNFGEVDKNLRSVEVENEPQTPRFQAPDTRSYYEFLDAPAVENEKLRLIENPTREDNAKLIDKNRYRITDNKRDLHREYIKGVSNARSKNYPNNQGHFVKTNNKSQRKSFLNTDLPVGINHMPGVDLNLDYTTPNQQNEFPANYYPLNDGITQLLNLGKQNSDVDGSKKYSPKSLEANMELDKNFRDLGLGSFREDDKMKQIASHLQGKVEAYSKKRF